MLRIEVCYATRDRAWRVDVTLEPGATAGDAVARSGLATMLSLDPGDLALAVFGRRATMTTTLEDGDRVELLRPLVVDPKDARRRRATKRAASADRTSSSGPNA